MKQGTANNADEETTNSTDEEAARILETARQLSEAANFTFAQAAEGIRVIADLATMKEMAANNEKYISLDNVCEILKRHGVISFEIYGELNEKAISPVDSSLLHNWYIDSIPEYPNNPEQNSPVWTMEHIEELIRDYALLPREDDNFSGNGYAKRYKEED